MTVTQQVESGEFSRHMLDRDAFVVILVFTLDSNSFWEFAIEFEGKLLFQSQNTYDCDMRALRDGLTWWIDSPHYVPLSQSLSEA